MNEKLIVYSTILVDDTWVELGDNRDKIYVWSSNERSNGDIDKSLIYTYELKREINFYYTKLARVNFKDLKFIKEIKYD